MKNAAFFVIIALLAFVSACQQQQQPVANTTANTASAGKADWDGYVAKFLNDYFAANPTFAVASAATGAELAFALALRFAAGALLLFELVLTFAEL